MEDISNGAKKGLQEKADRVIKSFLTMSANVLVSAVEKQTPCCPIQRVPLKTVCLVEGGFPETVCLVREGFSMFTQQ